MPEAVIVAASRTPIGRAAKGSLADVRPDDLLVVPETMVAEVAQQPWPGRRGVFVQGSFLTLKGHRAACRYPELGFDFALAVMPHVAAVVRAHFGIAARVVPPFVAPYFARSAEEVRDTVDQLRRTMPTAAWDELRAEGLLPSHVPVPAAAPVGEADRPKEESWG